MFYGIQEIKEMPLADLYSLKKEIESVYQEIQEEVRDVMPEFEQLNEGLNYPPLLGTTHGSRSYQRFLDRYNEIIDLFNRESDFLSYLEDIENEIFDRTKDMPYHEHSRRR